MFKVFFEFFALLYVQYRAIKVSLNNQQRGKFFHALRPPNKEADIISVLPETPNNQWRLLVPLRPVVVFT